MTQGFTEQHINELTAPPPFQCSGTASKSLPGEASGSISEHRSEHRLLGGAGGVGSWMRRGLSCHGKHSLAFLHLIISDFLDNLWNKNLLKYKLERPQGFKNNKPSGLNQQKRLPVRLDPVCVRVSRRRRRHNSANAVVVVTALLGSPLTIGL